VRVRSITCPGCGGRTQLSPGEEVAACLHCGRNARLSDALAAERKQARSFPPATPLQLGMKATYGGEEYEATGRQVMRQQEEGVTYTWEEWVLISPDGDLLYLEFDEGKWKIMRPFVPEQPLGPDELARLVPGAMIPVPGGSAMVQDTGFYRLVHAEGEFPYIVAPGRQLGFLDATRGGDVFAIEWTGESVEFYRGRYVDVRQVYVMFNLHALVEALDRGERLLKQRRRFGGVCVGLSVLTLFVWLASLGSGTVAPGGLGTVDLAQAAGPEGVRLGPVDLTAADRVHRLEVTGRMVGSSNWVQAVLEDETEQELLSAERDMWDESGYDSDGPWHESDLHASSDFVVRKPGRYYIRVYAEPEPGSVANGSASFVLRQRVLYPFYLGLYGLLTLFLGLGFLVAGSPATVQKAREGLQSAGDD
jgi:hypothetical protein